MTFCRYTRKENTQLCGKNQQNAKHYDTLLQVKNGGYWSIMYHTCSASVYPGLGGKAVAKMCPSSFQFFAYYFIHKPQRYSLVLHKDESQTSPRKNFREILINYYYFLIGKLKPWHFAPVSPTIFLISLTFKNSRIWNNRKWI